MPRAALYVRVSSDGQTTANQIPALERMALSRGCSIVRVVDDTHSTITRRRAPGLAELLELARTGGVDVIFIWALDRLDRSMQAVMSTVLEMDRVGVSVVSHQESWLDSSGPVRPLLLSIFGWVAQQERERLAERTRAGMERVKASGVHVGRPRARVPMREARACLASGMSVKGTARALRLPESTLRNALRAERGAAKVDT